MGTIKIFVSYSHQNEEWVSKDGKYKLIPWLERQLEGQAEIWTDHALKRLIGEEYTKLITEKILEADIVLLLISQDFVSSQYIMDVELPLIRNRYLASEVKILPLLLTDLTKKGKEKVSWIFDLQVYPNDTKPLIEYANNDAEWAKMKIEVLDGIENKVEDIILKIRHFRDNVIMENGFDIIKSTSVDQKSENQAHEKIHHKINLLRHRKIYMFIFFAFIVFVICISIYWFYHPMTPQYIFMRLIQKIRYILSLIIN